ncbi:MAG TPA: DUF4345 family protein [Phenylobacterium sp.]|uniref:DUF4345 family protein n=1 Tax=Phenylobacterium sp. TaxID=1871053 RepID=UPI002D2D9051|nr:DUF4345 family protein [Phenylobacterium sp.]HZZ67709.1 DUF4345 family protein [Phenylobacterium sp.]
MSPAFERRLLQIAIAVAGVVPVGGGLWGVLGHMSTEGALSTSNARYLSGLLLGIGLTFWIAIPTIERRGTIVRGLGAIIVIGGLARLAGAVLVTGFPPAVFLPMIMELGVTPLIALWRERVERRLTAA